MNRVYPSNLRTTVPQTPAMSPVMFFPTAVSLGRHRVITWPGDEFFARTRPGTGIDFASTGCLGRERTSQRQQREREGREKVMGAQDAEAEKDLHYRASHFCPTVLQRCRCRVRTPLATPNATKSPRRAVPYSVSRGAILSLSLALVVF